MDEPKSPRYPDAQDLDNGSYGEGSSFNEDLDDEEGGSDGEVYLVFGGQLAYPGPGVESVIPRKLGSVDCYSLHFNFSAVPLRHAMPCQDSTRSLSSLFASSRSDDCSQSATSRRKNCIRCRFYMWCSSWLLVSLLQDAMYGVNGQIGWVLVLVHRMGSLRNV